jgi:hypothetical protein
MNNKLRCKKNLDNKTNLSKNYIHRIIGATLLEWSKFFSLGILVWLEWNLSSNDIDASL